MVCRRALPCDRVPHACHRRRTNGSGLMATQLIVFAVCRGLLLISAGRSVVLFALTRRRTQVRILERPPYLCRSEPIFGPESTSGGAPRATDVPHANHEPLRFDRRTPARRPAMGPSRPRRAEVMRRRPGQNGELRGRRRVVQAAPRGRRSRSRRVASQTARLPSPRSGTA